MELISERAMGAIRAIVAAQVAVSWDLKLYAVDSTVQVMEAGATPAPTWVLLECGPLELAIWQETGAVHTVDEHGQASDDPIWRPGDGKFELPTPPPRAGARFDVAVTSHHEDVGVAGAKADIRDRGEGVPTGAVLDRVRSHLEAVEPGHKVTIEATRTP